MTADVRATSPAGSRPSVVVFDVNETLLDIEFLAPLFARLFGDGAVMREWFAQMVLYSEAMTLSGTYAPFGAIGAGILRMLGEIKAVPIAAGDIVELRERMQALPAHADVAEAMRALKAAGFRLVTLTNSAPLPDGGPMERAGIAPFFERQFSVDTTRRFKPAPENYRMVAQELGVDVSALCMVAAHAWDTVGAQQAGCAAALVTRPGNTMLDVLPVPDIVGRDLIGVAAEMIRRWH